MIGLIAKVGALAAGVGFGAGILAHRKAGDVSEDIKERFSNVQTEIIEVEVPKGTNLEEVRVVTKVLIPNYTDETQALLSDD